MPAQLKRRLFVFLLLVLLIALGFFAEWFWRGRFYESTDNAYVQGEITRVSSQLAARIDQVLVADNQHVEQGQLLIRLEGGQCHPRHPRSRTTAGAEQTDPAGQPDCRRRRPGRCQPGQPGPFADRPVAGADPAQARLCLRGTGHHPLRRQPHRPLPGRQGPGRPAKPAPAGQCPDRRTQAPRRPDRQRPHRTGPGRTEPEPQ